MVGASAIFWSHTLYLLPDPNSTIASKLIDPIFIKVYPKEKAGMNRKIQLKTIATLFVLPPKNLNNNIIIGKRPPTIKVKK
jgi:hypothetical protein